MSKERHSLQRQADRAKPGSRRSVLIYLVILFAVAFVLLLLSYIMQQRSSEETIDGLKQSVSAMQSAQDAYEENALLKQQLEQLEQQAETDQAERDRLQQQIQDLQQRCRSWSIPHRPWTGSGRSTRPMSGAATPWPGN